MNNFGNKIRELLIQKHFSQRQFARISGVSVGTLQRMLALPTAESLHGDTLLCVAKGFGYEDAESLLKHVNGTSAESGGFDNSSVGRMVKTMPSVTEWFSTLNETDQSTVLKVLSDIRDQGILAAGGDDAGGGEVSGGIKRATAKGISKARDLAKSGRKRGGQLPHHQEQKTA